MRPTLRWSVISACGLTAGLLAVNSIGGTAEPSEPASIELDVETSTGQHVIVDAVPPDLPERARSVSADTSDDEVPDDPAVVPPRVVSGDGAASANSPAAGNSPAPVNSLASADSVVSEDSVDSVGSADS